jgi:protein-disulfide isomerase
LVDHPWQLVSRILSSFSSDEHVLRPRAPRVQLMLYGDYTCMLTARHDAAIRSALGEIPDDVAYIYRHYPQGEPGRRAAECAVAAAFQDRFWSMHARLLSHQSQLDDASLVEHAVTLRLDVERFLKDLAGAMPRAKVQADNRNALAAGVTRTPGIFVQGQWLTHDLSSEQLLAHLGLDARR